MPYAYASKAEIIVCANHFHGRTVTIVSFSTDEQYRDGFGPFTPGFKVIRFGDVEALRKAITPNTCAFLVEPIQGEAGIVVPPAGFLKQAAEVCHTNRVLLITDEIQSGLGRTGKLFAYMHEGIRPDMLIVGRLWPADSIRCQRCCHRMRFLACTIRAIMGAPLVATPWVAQWHAQPCASWSRSTWWNARLRWASIFWVC